MVIGKEMVMSERHDARGDMICNIPEKMTNVWASILSERIDEPCCTSAEKCLHLPELMSETISISIPIPIPLRRISTQKLDVGI